MNNKKSVSPSPIPTIIMLWLLTAIPVAFSQNEENLTVLSPFTVSSEQDVGYYASNTISGTRIETPIKDLPQVINVVTSELISDLSAVRLEDALEYTPGVEVAAQANEGRFSIRGFFESTPAYNGVETQFFAKWDTAVIDRIEVVKGPSAPLYGTSFSPGGFINMVSKKPAKNQISEISLEADEEGRGRLVVDTTGPLTEKEEGAGAVRYRFIGVMQQGIDRSWMDFADGDRLVIAPSLAWDVTDRSQLLIEYYIDDYDMETFSTYILPLRRDGTTNQGAFLLDEVLSARGMSFNLNGPDSYDFTESEILNVYFTQAFNNAFSARFIYQRTEFAQQFLRNNGFLQVPNSTDPVRVASNVLARNFEATRDYFRLDFSFEASGDWGFLRTTGGLETFWADSYQTRFVDTNDSPFPLSDIMESDYRFNPLDTYTQNQDLGVDLRDSLLGNVVFEYRNPGDQVRVFGGLSSFFDEGDLRVTNAGAGDWAANPNDPVDWQLGGLWNMTKAMNLFALYATDNRLGAVDPNSSVPNGRFPNVESTSIELGTKFIFSEGALAGLSGTLSYFDIQTKNVVRQDFSQPVPVPLPSGTEEAKGIELEVFYNPPQLEGLSLIAGYGGLDGELTGFSGAQSIYNGSPLRNAPETTLKIWGKYMFPIGEKARFSTGLGLIYRDEQAPFGGVTAGERPFATAPSHTLVNLLLAYEQEFESGHRFSIQANVRNLTDEEHMAASSLGTPRILSVKASYRF